MFVVIGAALSLLAMALSGMAFLRISAGDWPFWTLAACLGLLGPAQALVMTSTQVLTMHEVPLGAAGAAGGVSQTAQRVMTAIGLSAVTAAFYASLGVRDAGAQPGQLVYGDAAVHAVIVVDGFLCVTLWPDRRHVRRWPQAGPFAAGRLPPADRPTIPHTPGRHVTGDRSAQELSAGTALQPMRGEQQPRKIMTRSPPGARRDGGWRYDGAGDSSTPCPQAGLA